MPLDAAPDFISAASLPCLRTLHLTGESVAPSLHWLTSLAQSPPHVPSALEEVCIGVMSWPDLLEIPGAAWAGLEAALLGIPRFRALSFSSPQRFLHALRYDSSMAAETVSERLPGLAARGAVGVRRDPFSTDFFPGW